MSACKVNHDFDSMVKKVEVTLNLDKDLDNIIYYLLCGRDCYLKYEDNFQNKMDLSMALNRTESAEEKLKEFNRSKYRELYSANRELITEEFIELISEKGKK